MLEFELQVVHSIPCDSTLDDPMYICEHTRRFLMSPDWVFFNVISNRILVTFNPLPWLSYFPLSNLPLSFSADLIFGKGLP